MVKDAVYSDGGSVGSGETGHCSIYELILAEEGSQGLIISKEGLTSNYATQRIYPGK